MDSWHQASEIGLYGFDREDVKAIESIRTSPFCFLYQDSKIFLVKLPLTILYNPSRISSCDRAPCHT